MGFASTFRAAENRKGRTNLSQSYLWYPSDYARLLDKIEWNRPWNPNISLIFVNSIEMPQFQNRTFTKRYLIL